MRDVCCHTILRRNNLDQLSLLSIVLLLPPLCQNQS
jgi:hypothetical protein